MLLITKNIPNIMLKVKKLLLKETIKHQNNYDPGCFCALNKEVSYNFYSLSKLTRRNNQDIKKINLSK